MGHRLDSSLLRSYDIRGIVGETLREADAYAVGQGFGSVLRDDGAQSVCVGYDGRLSSTALAAALVEGLQTCGLRVITIGLVPTPMLYYSVYHLAAGGGVMVTGSHNPPDHNGFKFMCGRRSFYGEDLQKLGKRIEEDNVRQGQGLVHREDVSAPYLDLLQMVVAKEEGMPSVVWDCGNGASGDVVKRLVARLAGRHKLICCDIDGTFPNHHPDPTVEENLVMVKDEVVKGGYDLGVAFDGDGDRVGIVDERGHTLYADMMLAFLAEDVLARYPNAVIVSDVKAGQSLSTHVRALGGTLRLVPTGHSIIKTKMADLRAPFGGEMSGHIFFADDYYGYDDGLYAALRFVRWFQGQGGKKLSVLRRQLVRSYHSGEVRIDCADGEQFQIVQGVADGLRSEGIEFSEVDGVRVSDETGWWLIRGSNTQGVIVAVCEATTEKDFRAKAQDMGQRLKQGGVDLPPMQPRA